MIIMKKKTQTLLLVLLTALIAAAGLSVDRARKKTPFGTLAALLPKKDTPRSKRIDSGMYINTAEYLSWQTFHYNNKRVLDWVGDGANYGKIIRVYDTVGALYAMVGQAIGLDKDYRDIIGQRDTLQMVVQALAETGKCPFGWHYYRSRHIGDMITMAGCYSTDKWREEQDTSHEPHLVVSVSVDTSKR